ncbi:cadherin-like domain-containing protein, partial [Marinicella sp. S1101]
PAQDFNGQGTFDYAISDGQGGTASASVTVTVTAVNDDPVAVNDAASTNEDELVAVSVLNGDSDVDTGDTLSVTSCSNASNGSVNRNGNNCEFTPAQDFNGQGTFD